MAQKGGIALFADEYHVLEASREQAILHSNFLDAASTLRNP